MDADYWIYATAGMDTVRARDFINGCLQTVTGRWFADRSLRVQGRTEAAVRSCQEPGQCDA